MSQNKFYIVPEADVLKCLNHESIYQGNIDLRAMLRLAKADEIPVHPPLKVITSAEFEGAVKAVKSLVTSYEHTVDRLKTQLASTANRLEEITIDNANLVEDGKKSYDFEATVNGWDLEYSAENLWVQEMMQAVIEYANKNGVVNLIDKLKL